MNFLRYQQYLKAYVEQAIQESDGSNRGIAEHLWGIQVKGFLVSHREEKQRALNDARQAFDQHRHWPRDIILSHLGISDK
jgi:hypothetical protein